MIALHFSGYFQARLAVNPDPTDEPRGVSGYAHAVEGEPDFDRIIRFHDPVALRTYAPKRGIGVFVDTVMLHGAPAVNHPLAGAPVQLLHDPRFEGRNGIIADYAEPIVPFTISIQRNDVGLRRDSGVGVAPYQELQAKGLIVSPAPVAAATGIWDFSATVRARLSALKVDVANETDEVRHAGLVSRIASLEQNLRFLPAEYAFRQLYAFDLTAAPMVHDPEGRLPRELTTNDPWHVDFWLGGWDADTMTGFVDGWLTVPPV